MTKTIDLVMEKLEQKGISPGRQDSLLFPQLTILTWRTGRSSYELCFDEKGHVIKGGIDGSEIYQDYGDTGPAWVCSRFSAPRFYTFEKWLGMDLFTCEAAVRATAYKF